MTLGNADGSLIFSPHNESKDREKAKSEHIFEVIHNKEVFFGQVWEVIIQSADKNLILAWDSYFLKWKDGNLSLLIGDFDQVCVWKKPYSLGQKIEKNIEEFFRLLSEIKDYFRISYGSEFLSFLQKKQEE